MIALSFHQDTWTGAVTITNASAATSSVAATGYTSRSSAHLLNAIKAAGRTLVHSSFDWSIATSGKITISAGANFALSFTGNSGTRLGFTGAKSGSSSYESDNPCSGVFAPYSSDAFLHSNDIRTASIGGVATSSGAVWMRTPKSDPKLPAVVLEVLRSKALQFLEAHAVIGNPSKVDLVDSDLALIEYYLGGVRVSERSRIEGFADIELEVST